MDVNELGAWETYNSYKRKNTSFKMLLSLSMYRCNRNKRWSDTSCLRDLRGLYCLSEGLPAPTPNHRRFLLQHNFHPIFLNFDFTYFHRTNCTGSKWSGCIIISSFWQMHQSNKVKTTLSCVKKIKNCNFPCCILM